MVLMLSNFISRLQVSSKLVQGGRGCVFIAYHATDLLKSVCLLSEKCQSLRLLSVLYIVVKVGHFQTSLFKVCCYEFNLDIHQRQRKQMVLTTILTVCFVLHIKALSIAVLVLMDNFGLS